MIYSPENDCSEESVSDILDKIIPLLYYLRADGK
jgi:hypothetical protein